MVEQDTVYTSREVAYGADSTQRIINHRASTGFFEPSINDSNGRGDPRGYSEDDIHSHAILRMFSGHGIPLKTLQPVERFLRGCDSIKLRDARARLVVLPSTHDVKLLHSDEAVVALLTRSGRGDRHIVVNTGAIIEEVTERLNEMRRERAAKAAASKKKRGGPHRKPVRAA